MRAVADLPESPTTTILLDERATAADRVAQLLPLVYEHLKAAARRHLAAERPGHTLSATALVHEAFLKLVGPRKIPWRNRAHFYAAAAEAMRQVLLDHARARGRIKRGGGLERRNLPLDEAATLATDRDSGPEGVDIEALDDAMTRLAARDARVAAIVRLKYYAGLDTSQIALALEVSERTVKSDWAFAKAWLERELRA